MKQSYSQTDRLPILRKRLREVQGELSNIDFAQKLGISRQTVGFYLNGDRIPDAGVLRQICEKCGVSADYLLGLSDTKSRDASVSASVKSTGLSETAVRALSDAQVLPGGASAVEAVSLLIENGVLLPVSGMLSELVRSIGYELSSPAYSFASTDEQAADMLLSEIIERYPELQGRVNVSCGGVKIDKQLDAITEEFTQGVKEVSGYYEYLTRKHHF